MFLVPWQGLCPVQQMKQTRKSSSFCAALFCESSRESLRTGICIVSENVCRVKMTLPLFRFSLPLLSVNEQNNGHSLVAFIPGECSAQCEDQSGIPLDLSASCPMPSSDIGLRSVSAFVVLKNLKFEHFLSKTIRKIPFFQNNR